MSKVNIRPGVSVLAVLRHLNYKTWFALAEFVDNSVESYSKNKPKIQKISGDAQPLTVSIDIDSSSPARISIRDNAAGIAFSDFSRAFRPAAIPPDRSGLSEFGMGMKSAACWFAPCWSVRTSAIGDDKIREVRFDIENIVNDEIVELDIQETVGNQNQHFTEIILEGLFHVPQGKNVAKLKEHLSDIYRILIRNGELVLNVNGEPLSPVEIPILKAAYFSAKEDPDQKKQTWKKDIHFDFGEGLSVSGFAALRETASTTKAGFSLFRRGRVIEGSGDEGYRPQFIFGKPNSYTYQRLFGELHLDGFDVSHTKDGFRWDENEQPFLELLRESLNSAPLPLLKQAEGFRARVAKKEISDAAKSAVASTASAIENNLTNALPSVQSAKPTETSAEQLPERDKLASQDLTISHRGKSWEIHVELIDDPAESQWLAVSDKRSSGERAHKIEISVSTSHPFMVRFAQINEESLEALLKVAASLAIAEVTARDSGVRNAASIRRNMNEIMLRAFASD